jgi:hypothetical protein
MIPVESAPWIAEGKIKDSSGGGEFKCDIVGTFYECL